MDAYSSDKLLLERYGLATQGFRRSWTDLGTAVVIEADPDGEFGPRPATTVRVEVSAYPVQFWRLTVTRPQENGLNEDGTTVYEPCEVLAIKTGSGSFCTYWPAVEMVATHCFEVEARTEAHA